LVDGEVADTEINTREAESLILVSDDEELKCESLYVGTGKSPITFNCEAHDINTSIKVTIDAENRIITVVETIDDETSSTGSITVESSVKTAIFTFSEDYNSFDGTSEIYSKMNFDDDEGRVYHEISTTGTFEGVRQE